MLSGLSAKDVQKAPVTPDKEASETKDDDRRGGLDDLKITLD